MLPAKDKINLLPKDQFENTPLGKFIDWAINVGRWIVVFTELIVICAFLSRFYFDTELSNLFDKIRIKKTMIEANTVFEDNFRQTQDKIKMVKNLLSGENVPSTLFTDIAKIMPLDLTFKNISVSNGKVSMSGFCLSENGLRAFLGGLKGIPSLTKINVTNLAQKDALTGIEFNITAELNK